MQALEELGLIWAGVLVAVWAARRTRLTPVLYYLAVGAVMVNVGLLRPEPDAFIRGFAEVGIVLIMFALGFEEHMNHFLSSIKRSWGIAFFGALAPFITAFAIAEFFWEDSRISLICGLAMTATSVSLTMVALRSEGLQATPAATRIMTSAILDDIAALALLAIIIPIATGETTPPAIEIEIIVAKVIAFFLVVTALGLWVFPHDSVNWTSRIPILNRFNMRALLSFENGDYATLIILLLALSVGLLAHAFGFHPAVGAYMAGLILREEYFHVGTQKGLYTETKKIVDNVAFSWIGPVFFVVLGTQLVFDADLFIAVIPQTIVMTVGLLVAQILSAAIAARYTSGMAFAASLMIGFGMLGRAELAFVVMDIGYVQHPILSEQAFYTLMVTTFWLNLAVPLTIRYWKPYYERELTRQALAAGPAPAGPSLGLPTGRSGDAQ